MGAASDLESLSIKREIRGNGDRNGRCIARRFRALGLSEEGCDGLVDLVRPLLEVDTACEAAGTTRNGFCERRLETQVGTITLRMSKLRQGAYFPDCLVERWSRVACIVICAVVETYALGVSTRKVVRVLERMEPTGFPKTRSRASTRRSMLKWQSCARISCRPYNSLPLGRRDLRALQEKTGTVPRPPWSRP